MPTARPTAIPGQLSTRQPAAAGAIHRGRRMRQNVYAYRSYRRPPGSVIVVGNRGQRKTRPRRVQRAYRLRRHRNACPGTIPSIVQHDLSTLEPCKPSPARLSRSNPPRRPLLPHRVRRRFPRKRLVPDFTSVGPPGSATVRGRCTMSRQAILPTSPCTRPGDQSEPKATPRMRAQ
jgi:hypothetical protein